MTDEAEIDALYADVGRRVRSARVSITQERREAWTQEQLARKLGLTRSSVANLEAGRQRIPLHILFLIAENLRVPLADLLPERFIQSAPAHTVQLPEDLEPSSRAFILACLANIGANSN